MEDSYLTNLINEVDGYNKERIEKFGYIVKNCIITDYSWKYLTDRYIACFKEVKK